MPVDHIAEAQKVIDLENSIEFLVKTFLSIYVGNKETGQLLIATIGCQAELNSDGIHPKFSGGRGISKTIEHGRNFFHTNLIFHHIFISVHQLIHR